MKTEAHTHTHTKDTYNVMEDLAPFSVKAHGLFFRLSVVSHTHASTHAHTHTHTHKHTHTHTHTFSLTHTHH